MSNKEGYYIYNDKVVYLYYSNDAETTVLGFNSYDRSGVIPYTDQELRAINIVELEDVVILDNAGEGWFHLYSPAEEQPSLVRLYFHVETEQKVLGFNTWEGGHHLQVNDLLATTRVVAVRLDIV